MRPRGTKAPRWLGCWWQVSAGACIRLELLLLRQFSPGRITAWVQAGLPVERPSGPSYDQERACSNWTKDAETVSKSQCSGLGNRADRRRALVGAPLRVRPSLLRQLESPAIPRGRAFVRQVSHRGATRAPANCPCPGIGFKWACRQLLQRCFMTATRSRRSANVKKITH
jgi:hypothetical protein